MSPLGMHDPQKPFVPHGRADRGTLGENLFVTRHCLLLGVYCGFSVCTPETNLWVLLHNYYTTGSILRVQPADRQAVVATHVSQLMYSMSWTASLEVINQTWLLVPV